jgi:hypothetical protein
MRQQFAVHERGEGGEREKGGEREARRSYG